MEQSANINKVESLYKGTPKSKSTLHNSQHGWNITDFYRTPKATKHRARAKIDAPKHLSRGSTVINNW